MSKKASTAGIQPSRAQFVRQKSLEALKRWKGSETDRQSPHRSRKNSKVQFYPGTVLLFAVSIGDVDEVRLLLASRTDVNYQNVDGLTALHQACMDERVDLVKMLIDAGARSDLRDNEGWTPLHVAAHCGNVELARLLIINGADLVPINNDGDLPIDFAEEEEKEDMINFLKKEIEKRGIDVEKVRAEEERVMREHAQNWLYRQKIDETPDRSGGTALHVACAKGYLKVIDLLLQAGVDVNAKDIDGWTPVHAAAYWNQEEVLEILSEHGAQLDATDKVGKTAADIADEEIKDVIKKLEKKQKERRNVKAAPQPIRTNAGVPASRTRRVSITRVKAPNLSLGDIIQERAALEATKQGSMPHFSQDRKNRRGSENDSSDSEFSTDDSESDEEPIPSTPSPVTSPRRKVAVALNRPELPSLTEVNERGRF